MAKQQVMIHQLNGSLYFNVVAVGWTLLFMMYCEMPYNFHYTFRQHYKMVMAIYRAIHSD